MSTTAICSYSMSPTIPLLLVISQASNRGIHWESTSPHPPTMPTLGVPLMKSPCRSTSHSKYLMAGSVDLLNPQALWAEYSLGFIHLGLPLIETTWCAGLAISSFEQLQWCYKYQLPFHLSTLPPWPRQEGAGICQWVDQHPLFVTQLLGAACSEGLPWTSAQVLSPTSPLSIRSRLEIICFEMALDIIKTPDILSLLKGVLVPREY